MECLKVEKKERNVWKDDVPIVHIIQKKRPNCTIHIDGCRHINMYTQTQKQTAQRSCTYMRIKGFCEETDELGDSFWGAEQNKTEEEKKTEKNRRRQLNDKIERQVD